MSGEDLEPFIVSQHRQGNHESAFVASALQNVAGIFELIPSPFGPHARYHSVVVVKGSYF